MRIMCLDVGRARVGIAQSDPMAIIATPLEVYKRTNSINNDAKHVAELIKSNEVGLLVIGLPLKLDGSESDSTIMAKEFAEKIEAYIPSIDGETTMKCVKRAIKQAKKEMVGDNDV